MSPFFTIYSLLRNSIGLMERASSLVKPISVFLKSGTYRRSKMCDVCIYNIIYMWVGGACTIFPRIEAPSGVYFLLGPSTRPLNEAGLYMGPASIYTCSSRSGFLRVLFCTVYSSKLESDIVALSFGHNGDQCSCETRI